MPGTGHTDAKQMGEPAVLLARAAPQATPPMPALAPPEPRSGRGFGTTLSSRNMGSAFLGGLEEGWVGPRDVKDLSKATQRVAELLLCGDKGRGRAGRGAGRKKAC